MKNCMQLLVYLCVFLLPFANVSVAQKMSLTIGTSGKIDMFSYLDEDGNLAGYEIDLGNALCARMNADCTWKTSIWDHLLPDLRNDVFDMVISTVSIADRRKAKLRFSKEYFPTPNSAYLALRRKNVDTRRLTDLRIGVLLGTLQEAYAMENLSQKNRIKRYRTSDRAAVALFSGSIDVLLSEKMFLVPLIVSSAGALGFVGDDIRVGDGYGIAVNKSNKALLKKINKALAEAKADGTVDRLLKQYFDWDPIYSNN